MPTLGGGNGAPRGTRPHRPRGPGSGPPCPWDCPPGAAPKGPRPRGPVAAVRLKLSPGRGHNGPAPGGPDRPAEPYREFPHDPEGGLDGRGDPAAGGPCGPPAGRGRAGSDAGPAARGPAGAGVRPD